MRHIPFSAFKKKVLAASRDSRTRRNILFFTVSTVIVLIWCWPLMTVLNMTSTGDWDYFAQGYEAIRKTVLEYRQFPWVNIWIGGGVPLYANPQMGVFSIQTILVLLFGTLIGLKLSILIYTLTGFWSMYVLLRRIFDTNRLLSTGLSIIWITNGFFASHAVGHYTFHLFQLFPLLLLLLLRIRQPRYWLYLGIALAAMVHSAFHYAVFQSGLILTLIALALILQNRKDYRSYLVLYAKTITIFALLSIHRIVYTIDYALDFPRFFREPPNSIEILLKAFVLPPDQTKWLYDTLQTPVSQSSLVYGWGEYNAFVGYFFVFAFIISLVSLFYIKKNRVISKWQLLFFGAIPFAFILIAKGSFWKISPYSVLHMLPGFSGMRVPSRWLVWSILFGLLFVGFIHNYLRGKWIKGTITVLVLLGAFETYAVTLRQTSFFTLPVNIYRSSEQPFEYVNDYDHLNPLTNPESYAPRPELDRTYQLYAYEATLNGYGEAKGYEPLIDTRFTPTERCSVIDGCNFVKSRNAKIIYWSPNKVVLGRLDDKPIELNMNPSDYYLVNNTRIYANSRTAEVLEKFTITDKQAIIVIEANPNNILETVGFKFKRKLSAYYPD